MASNQLDPEYVYEEGQFVARRSVMLEGDTIRAIEPRRDGKESRVALMSGFVNAHSHAFQRGMRGQAEVFRGSPGSFFSWREAMYSLVEGLTEETTYDHSLQTFNECLAAGFTSVGEFHYIHHGATPWSLDEVVLAAAKDAGIRLVLLQSDYVRGGEGVELAGGQRRFDTGSIEAFVASIDRLESHLDASTQSIGLVSHSVRAVEIDRIVAIKHEAARRGLVFHMHVEEVVKEVEATIAEHGCTPMRLLLDHGVVDATMSAVHCTHSTPEDLRDFGAAGGTVCLCPLTEGNLGDGIPNLPVMRDAKCRVAIGSDLNARLAPLEELRSMEYTARIANQQRGVWMNEAGSTAAALLEVGTRGGAVSLGLNAGELAPGALADMVAFDLTHPSLQGVEAEDLAAAIIFGAGQEAIAGVMVGGTWVLGGID